MKTVSILVPEAAVMQAIADPRYLFTTVNQFLAVAGKQPLFEVQLVGASKEVLLQDGMYTVHPDKLLKEATKSDLVFVPALFGNIPDVLAANKKLIPWIVEQYSKGAEVASLCVGAFLLASTGLLNGKKCSTHWGFTNEFREMFPEVEVVDGSIITEEARLYSSGGANSYWNLLLYLVEKYTTRGVAIHAAKYFVIDLDRNNQSPFVVFRGQKDHEDELIKKIQEFIEHNFREKLTVDQVSVKFNMTRRTVERRFKKATRITIAEYIQRVKIEAAKKLLEMGRKSIPEVMTDIGYSDTQTFRDVFKRITDMTPVDYRNKYNN